MKISQLVKDAIEAPIVFVGFIVAFIVCCWVLMVVIQALVILKDWF
jgi:hypothetical protein